MKSLFVTGTDTDIGKTCITAAIAFALKKSDIKNYKLSELIYWFKTPQKYWLNKNNISPKEIFIHHPDEEYVSNLQKSKLITKIIQNLDGKKKFQTMN